jgi:hypothetical protein
VRRRLLAGPAAARRPPDGAALPRRGPPHLEELYAELDALVGLETVKREIRQQAELLRVQHLREQAGLAEPPITRHLVFTGNPGTGDHGGSSSPASTAPSACSPPARLTEVDKAGLSRATGQSEEKTAKVLAAADGGVLFIDEAYSLTGDDFGESVIDLLV